MVSPVVGRRRRPLIGSDAAHSSPWRIVYALVCAAFGYFDSAAPVIVMFLCYGVYFGLTEGVEKAWVATCTGTSPRHGVRRVHNAALGLGGLASSLMFGAIWTRVSPQAAFSLARGGSLAIGLLYFLFSCRQMKKILVTNDDGVRSEGIHALAEALKPLGEVTVVGPQTEASAIGHALTLRRRFGWRSSKKAS